MLNHYYDRWQENKLIKPKYYGKTREDIKNLWEDERKEAAQLGTNLHEAIENYYLGIDCCNLNCGAENGEEWNYFRDFERRYKLKQRVHRVEWKIWSRELKLAGTIDLIAVKDDGTYAIYDWK